MFNMSSKDLRAVSVPLLVFTAVCALGTGAVLYSEKLVAQARDEVRVQEDLLAQASSRVQQSDSERAVIERYVRPYVRLQGEGMVGEEQRIGWIDALRVANSEADLYGVNYEVGAQQAYTFLNEVNAGTLSVRESIMQLRINLLHEEDLLRFFQALAALKVGQFAVNECSLRRLTDDPVVPVNRPTLTAECVLAWITIVAPVAVEHKS
jgi:hypothetical protein